MTATLESRFVGLPAPFTQIIVRSVDGIAASSRRPTASKISESGPSEPPPPPPPLELELELVALVKSTVAIAIAAGGAPVHVIPYVRLPALDSLIFIEPESAREPDQPSPASPPVAVQPSEFFVLHESVTLCATTCELILLVSVTAGVGVVDPKVAGAV
jgi:hypothetical protein